MNENNVSEKAESQHHHTGCCYGPRGFPIIFIFIVMIMLGIGLWNIAGDGYDGTCWDHHCEDDDCKIEDCNNENCENEECDNCANENCDHKECDDDDCWNGGCWSYSGMWFWPMAVMGFWIMILFGLMFTRYRPRSGPRGVQRCWWGMDGWNWGPCFWMTSRRWYPNYGPSDQRNGQDGPE